MSDAKTVKLQELFSTDEEYDEELYMLMYDWMLCHKMEIKMKKTPDTDWQNKIPVYKSTWSFYFSKKRVALQKKMQNLLNNPRKFQDVGVIPIEENESEDE